MSARLYDKKFLNLHTQKSFWSSSCKIKFHKTFLLPDLFYSSFLQKGKCHELRCITPISTEMFSEKMHPEIAIDNFIDRTSTHSIFLVNLTQADEQLFSVSVN